LLWRLTDRWFAPAPDPARVGWLRNHVYAHRGFHDGDRVENSASAFSAALTAGLGIECDIQRSLDDWPMVFHDWDFSRLIGRPDACESWMKDEWQKLRYLGSEDWPLTLADLLAQVGGAVPLLIEIKSQPGYDVEWTCLEVVRALKGYAGQHAVMSFDPRASRWLARNSPTTVRGLVVSESNKTTGSAWQRRLALWTAKPDFLAYDVRDLPSPFAARQRARGLPLLTWTVSEKARLATARAFADAPIAESEGLEEALRKS
jgi:glycerophosphoryl diester phosphodiesterase